MLDNKRIEGIRNSINEIIKFKDPIGVSHAQWKRPNGLLIKKSFNAHWSDRSNL